MSAPHAAPARPRAGRPPLPPKDYVVIHEDTVVQKIRAKTANEALAQVDQPGDLYLKVHVDHGPLAPPPGQERLPGWPW